MDRTSEALALDDRSWLLVLTGAGVSAESGLATFRGAGGLWEGRRVEEVASPEAFAADPALVWRFYGERRKAALRAEPNHAHHALAALERRLGERFLLVTQTVDGLHARAGSRTLLELHGNLFRSRCSRCAAPARADSESHEGAALPCCPACAQRGEKALLRPDIVWFGESLERKPFERIAELLQRARRGRLCFLAVGTSGTVYPAAALVELAARCGAERLLVDVAPDAEHAARYDRVLRATASEGLSRLFPPQAARRGGPGRARVRVGRRGR